MKNILFLLLFGLLLSCSNEDITPYQREHEVELTDEVDKWLYENLQQPYNCVVRWKWDDNFMNEKDYYENRIDTDSIEGIGIPRVYIAQPQKIYIRTYLSQGILESSVPSVARVGYLSYAPDAKFYAPQYATPESRKIVNSDKRSTLYWEPDIRLNDKGEVGFSFYTADRPSTYTVVIEGITTDGKACRYVKTIR